MAILKIREDGIVYKVKENGKEELFVLNGEKIYGDFDSGFLYIETQWKKLKEKGVAEPFFVEKIFIDNERGNAVFRYLVPKIGPDNFIYFPSSLGEKGIRLPLEDTDITSPFFHYKL